MRPPKWRRISNFLWNYKKLNIHTFTDDGYSKFMFFYHVLLYLLYFYEFHNTRQKFTTCAADAVRMDRRLSWNSYVDGVINDTKDFCNIINIVANNALHPHLHLTKYKIPHKKGVQANNITYMLTCYPNAIIFKARTKEL